AVDLLNRDRTLSRLRPQRGSEPVGAETPADASDRRARCRPRAGGAVQDGRSRARVNYWRADATPDAVRTMAGLRAEALPHVRAELRAQAVLRQQVLPPTKAL